MNKYRLQFKAVFGLNDLNDKICHECGEKLIVKEVDVNVWGKKKI